jgi:hypothetical protein
MRPGHAGRKERKKERMDKLIRALESIAQGQAVSDLPTPTVAIGDIFTDMQIRAARAIYKKHKGEIGAVSELRARVVEPAMAQINEFTGQENDARYFAYALYYALLKGDH